MISEPIPSIPLNWSLEEAFDIEIPDEVAEKIDTVGKAVDHISEAVA
jgi:acyl carrier protein